MQDDAHIMKNSSFFVWPLYLPHHIVNKNIVCVYFYVNKNVFILFKAQVMLLSHTSIQVHKNNITFPLNTVVVRFWPSLQRYYCTVCAYYTTFYIIYVTRLDLNSNGQFSFAWSLSQNFSYKWDYTKCIHGHLSMMKRVK